jgi:hypothetical protein
MERRVRPVADLRDESVLDGIVVNVIDVPSQIFFVTDRVLPETSLPQSIFSAPVALIVEPLGDDVPRKKAFDALPSSGKIRVIVWKGHDDMQMIRQHDDGIDRERMLTPRDPKGAAQQSDVFDENRRPAIGQRGGEEKRPACYKISSIENHSLL